MLYKTDEPPKQSLFRWCDANSWQENQCI